MSENRNIKETVAAVLSAAEEQKGATLSADVVEGESGTWPDERPGDIVTETELERILRLSAYMLPDDPTGRRWKPREIRQSMYRPLLEVARLLRRVELRGVDIWDDMGHLDDDLHEAMKELSAATEQDMDALKENIGQDIDALSDDLRAELKHHISQDDDHALDVTYDAESGTALVGLRGGRMMVTYDEETATVSILTGQGDGTEAMAASDEASAHGLATTHLIFGSTMLKLCDAETRRQAAELEGRFAELVGHMGDPSQLTMGELSPEEKTNLVEAINTLTARVVSNVKRITCIEEAVGNKDLLTTQSKGNLVSAINELKEALDSRGHVPLIGENGNWWIDGTDTGLPARGEQGYSGVTPSETVPYAVAVEVAANHMTYIAMLSGDISITLGPGMDGYDNEWNFTVTMGETVYAVTLPYVRWGAHGLAPAFPANTVTVCRLYRVSGILCGEWVTV